MSKQMGFEDKLITGVKIRIGKKYAEKHGFKNGEIIQLEMLPFEFDNDLGGGVDYCAGIKSKYDNDSIYHLFGNDFEYWLDCEIIK